MLTRQVQGEDPRWFLSAWLYTECYFYRRINETIRNSSLLHYLDPFKAQKCEALTVSMPAVISLANFLKESVEQINSNEQIYRFLMDFIEVCLWGNKCDLSISAGVQNAQKISVESNLHTLSQHILCDNKASLGKYFQSISHGANIHIVLDNAGFELFSDLVLMEFLLSSKIASKITLHGKAMPWFVSDVTKEDFEWTLEQLIGSESDILKYYGNKWKGYLHSEVVIYKAEDFWTLPYDFSQMKETDPSLYKELGSADLVFYKGDLNYRKLTGDYKWQYNTSFKSALRGYLPSPICALRTIKCDLVVGITKEIAVKTQQEDKDWLYDARWAVLQFAQ